MSYFSYIAFPRKVDISCLESKFDKSKAFTVGEIRGTDLEKQWEAHNGGSLAELPDELGVYFGDFYNDFLGIEILDIYMAIDLDGIFTNPFVYNFEGRFNLLNEEELLNGYKEIRVQNETEWDEAELLSEVKTAVKNNYDNVNFCKKQLYDIARLNLKPNEAIEIYTGWMGNDKSKFKPLKNTIEIDVEDIFELSQLDLVDRTKIVIKRT